LSVCASPYEKKTIEKCAYLREVMKSLPRPRDWRGLKATTTLII
jgi:hypothetical protein